MPPRTSYSSRSYLGPGKTKTVDAEIENGPMGAITAVQVTRVNLT
ncbi:hypothetical protein [Streptomyces sp. MAR4 CNX-425]